MRNQCSYVQATLILTQAKLGEAFKTMVAKQLAWCEGCKSLDSGHSSEPSTGSVWKEQTGPCVPQILDTILSCLVLWEWKSTDVSQELPMKIAVP